MGKMNSRRAGRRTPSPTSAMPLETEIRGDAVVVTLHGRIGELESGRLERELAGMIEATSPRLVLDLGDVPFITSAFLSALMAAYRRARAGGGWLRIANCQPLVRQVLEVTRLTKLFGQYEDIEQALAG